MSDGQAQLDTHRAAIIGSAVEHYRRTHQPALLSSIGYDFSKQFGPFKQYYDVPLAKFIKTHLTDQLRFPEGRSAGPTAAVEPIKDEMVPTSEESTNYVQDILHKYPRSLVIAFCLKTSENTDVYFSTQAPYRYTEIPAHDPAPGPNFRLIDSNLRIGKRSTDLTSEDHALLRERISDWARSNGLEGVFQHAYARRIEHPLQLSSASRATTTALDRLIQAQKSELRDKLMIPADIAELLSHRD